MRRALVCSLLALVLAGCGGTATVGGTVSPAPSTPGASSPGDSSPGSSAGGSGDCSALTKQDLATFIVGSQVLAQVRDKDTLSAASSGVMGSYTPDTFGTLLAKLSFLTGDAAEGLAKITAANDAVKKLASGSPTQADLDAYQQQTGGVAGVLKAQLAVNLGLAKACPSLG